MACCRKNKAMPKKNLFFKMRFLYWQIRGREVEKMIRFPKICLWGGYPACFIEGGYKEKGKKETHRVMILKLLVT